MTNNSKRLAYKNSETKPILQAYDNNLWGFNMVKGGWFYAILTSLFLLGFDFFLKELIGVGAFRFLGWGYVCLGFVLGENI